MMIVLVAKVFHCCKQPNVNPSWGVVSSDELKGRLDTQLDMELTDRVTVTSIEPPVKLTHVVKDTVGLHSVTLPGIWVFVSDQ